MTDALSRLGEANRLASEGKRPEIDDPRKAGAAKKGGRPSKRASEKRTHKMCVYLSSGELEAILKRSEALGVAPAVYLRERALADVK